LECISQSVVTDARTINSDGDRYMTGKQNYIVRRQRSSIGGTLSMIWRNRHLAAEMIQRDIKERYISQTFSWAWLVVQPAITTIVYLIVFAFIFNARIDGSSSRGDYVTFLLSGLVPWITVSDVLNRSVVAISGTPMFVKQMVFPIEVLPLKIFGSAALSFTLSSAIFLAYVLGSGRGSAFLLLGWPASVLCLSVFLIGSSYLLSAVGVFLRDIRDIVQLYSSIGLFASPALFSFNSLGTTLKIAVLLNPATPFILMFQDSAFAGSPEHMFAWILGPSVAVVMVVAGIQLFSSVRPMMADVL
jgi:lipopolysaccharide transport system permease protein